MKQQTAAPSCQLLVARPQQLRCAWYQHTLPTIFTRSCLHQVGNHLTSGVPSGSTCPPRSLPLPSRRPPSIITLGKRNESPRRDLPHLLLVASALSARDIRTHQRPVYIISIRDPSLRRSHSLSTALFHLHHPFGGWLEPALRTAPPRRPAQQDVCSIRDTYQRQRQNQETIHV